MLELLNVYNETFRKRCVVLDTETGTKFRIRYYQYVWRSFYGDIPEGYEIHHIDSNHENNDISNLTIMTRSEHHRYHALNMTAEHKGSFTKSGIGKKYHLGKKASEETKQKMSKARLGKSKRKGYKLSDETRAKMSKSRLGNKNAKKKR